MCEYSIDNSWIEEFDELDKEYAQYYTEDLLYIHLRCVYINSLNEIEQIKEAPVQLISPNHISRDELIGILKRNMQLSHKKYTVLSMLKYNIDIEAIKQCADIVTVVENYAVKLKKAGHDFKGLCPFHKEKTPSFIVYPEEKRYHCYGCQADGDVIGFVMKIENCDFKSAVLKVGEIR